MASSPRPRSDAAVRPLYRAVLLLGLGAVVILVAGAVDFFAFEPPGQQTGQHAKIQGVYAYNAKTQRVHGSAETSFAPDQPFAAVVDWSSVDPNLVVAARWFDSLGEQVGQVGPAAAGDVPSRIVPVALPEGLDRNIPGTYYFVVERIANGKPVEVLARIFIEVTRS